MNTHVRIEQQSQQPAREKEERVAADAKLQGAFLRAMTRGQDAIDSAPLPQSLDPELTSLVERFCSEVYVAEGSRTLQPRLLLTLQGAAQGASAEIFREGAFLRIRLRAGSAETHDRMQSRRALLVDALTDHGKRSAVIVEVVREQGVGDGSAR